MAIILFDPAQEKQIARHSHTQLPKRACTRARARTRMHTRVCKRTHAHTRTRMHTLTLSKAHCHKPRTHWHTQGAAAALRSRPGEADRDVARLDQGPPQAVTRHCGGDVALHGVARLFSEESGESSMLKQCRLAPHAGTLCRP